MTRAVKLPDGRVKLVASAQRDATEEAIDENTDKVMMAAMKDEGMDMPTLQRLRDAVTPRNVIVALSRMVGRDLSMLCKRIGLTGIPHSSNKAMQEAILERLDLETEPSHEVFDHALIFDAMRQKPTVFPGQVAAIKRALKAYEKAKQKDAAKN